MHKGHKTQVAKYGGPEGYAAEMARRRSMRKDYSTSGFAAMKASGQMDKIVAASKRSAEVRRAKKATETDN